jgi:branched-chain amino acid aminotransferase
MVDVYPELKVPLTPLSHLKTNNGMLYVMAGFYQKEKKLDECLLINARDEIASGIGSSVFMVSGGVLLTPPLASGCGDEVMRKKVMEYAEREGLEVDNRQPLFLDDFLKAEEVFFANATEGIRWVSGIRKKRYFKQTARQLTARLNKETAID